MRTESRLNDAELERLSALVDGELDSGESASRVCKAWYANAELRASWHAYQMIGDVLRSDDLACDARAETVFLAGFRSRMANEPIVLAPQMKASSAVLRPQLANGKWRSWRWPSAVAGGMVVLGVTLSQHSLTTGSNSVADVSASSMPAGAIAVAKDSEALAANDQMIRDVRLDRYLAAHKQFAGSTALGVPSSFLRNATAVEMDAAR